ncbi:hypothetical protein BJV78DRAFT_1278830 [Lactifluus subvellereus]|nr:hypothetical protein BJV78DRAFT_1278830 [Lactifluus subvellereus]
MSTPGGDSHSGSSFSEQGRTTLPPLTIAFPTSDSPVSGNYPYPTPYTTQQRSTPVPYEQPYYSSTQQQTQAGYAGYPSHQQLSDARYPSGQPYGPYRGTSPSSSAADSRRLMPLSVPRDDRLQGSQYYPQPQSHADLQMLDTMSNMRSPHPGYPPASNYPPYQSVASTGYPSGHSSSRGTAAAAAPVNPHYHHHHLMPMSHPSVERTVPSLRTTTQSPYTRAAPAMSPTDDESQPGPAEPTIKKKRKRADARQLEVLNATYERTAFPSTEERAAIAKQLDMSARSVQIWFQNKRQSMRQGGRTTSSAGNSSSNPVPVPVPTPTPPGVGYPSSPALVSPMERAGPTYTSRSLPPAMVRPTQPPSPPSGRSRADMDPRRHWPGPSRGY